MKTKKIFLSMAALALVGAMMTGCSSDDNFAVEQQPENKNNVVTLTATVGFDDAASTTRAVTGTGVKTFGAGDQMAVIYKNTSGGTVKAVGTLTSGAGTKSGTFTFTLTNPDKTQNVTYIYPAAMAGSTGVDYTKLNSQSGGTLTDLGSKYDLATNSGAWNAGALPSLTLNNQLAILAINLKNGSTDITSTITGMTLGDGTNTYSVTREAAAGPIYVAIQPTTSASISITATDGSKNYAKSLTGKDYAANNGYSVSWTVKQQYSFTFTGPYSHASLKMEFYEGDTWNDMAAKYPTYIKIYSGKASFYTDGFIYDSKNKMVSATAQIDPNATYTVQ